MTGRLPAYFGLDRYSISAADVVRMTLGCEPSRIRPHVLVTPIWSHEVFLTVAALEETMTPGAVYSLRFNGHPLTLIRSGIGAPQTGEAVLALGCTDCASIIFVGSVGGLLPQLTIGDLIVAEESMSGDGFSSYLPDGPLAAVPSLSLVAPNQALTARVENLATEQALPCGVPVTTGRVYSTDSIIAQFHHLDEITGRHRCIGIEMETSAVFRASALAGIPAAALLQISDVIPRNKSLFCGRTEAEQQRRKELRRTVVARIVLESLLGLSPGGDGQPAAV